MTDNERLALYGCSDCGNLTTAVGAVSSRPCYVLHHEDRVPYVKTCRGTRLFVGWVKLARPVDERIQSERAARRSEGAP